LVAFFQYLVNSMLTVLLIKPFVLGDLVIVDLLVEDVLLSLRFVSLNKSVLVLNGP
jgi:hypothetical protein